MRNISSMDARQGRRGKPVLLVLVGGLVLAGFGALVLEPFDGREAPVTAGRETPAN